MASYLSHCEKLTQISDRLWLRSNASLDADELPSIYTSRQEEIALEEDSIDFGPRFCSPLPTHIFNPAYEHASGPRVPKRWPHYDFEWHGDFGGAARIADYFHNYMGTACFRRDLLRCSSWVGFDSSWGSFRQICGFRPRGTAEDRWDMRQVYSIKSRKQRHMACIMADAAAADDRLLASELICAIHLIKAGMDLEDHVENKIIPVFLYSFSGQKARVVQVHYDGSHLIVRTTDFVNLEEENQDKIRLLLRWFMNTPFGADVCQTPDVHDQDPTEDADIQNKPLAEALDIPIPTTAC